MAEELVHGYGSNIIFRDDAFFIVSDTSDEVIMWDKDGVWHSTDGIDGTFVKYDFCKEKPEENDGRVFYG